MPATNDFESLVSTLAKVAASFPVISDSRKSDSIDERPVADFIDSASSIQALVGARHLQL